MSTILRQLLKADCSNTKKKTLHDCGYTFNLDGYLRKIDAFGQPTSDAFEFNISNDQDICQKNYEDLGEGVTEYVYEKLQIDEGLVKLPVPEGSDVETGTFVFVSKDYETKKKLLVLIHGSGVVRAGQWARSIIINDDLYKGSQIPYIRRGLQEGYGILVMNTNDNFRRINGKENKIPRSGDSNEHAVYVWEQYIVPTKAESIAFVAHSYGGINTLTLANKYKDDFENRVKAVAFTDSVHPFSSDCKVTKHLKKVGRNWVASAEPLDHAVSTPDGDVSRVSAGHRKHEMTSHAAMESVFRFFAEKIH